MNRQSNSLINAIVFSVCVLLMIAVILPPIAKQRSHARSVICSNNLKQIGLSIHNYHSAYKRVPMAYGGTRGGEDHQSNQGRLSFLVGLTPFLEQQALWEKIANPYPAPGKIFPPMGPAPWYDATEYLPWGSSPSVYQCPSTPNKKQDKRSEQPKIVYTLKAGADNVVGVMTNYVACFGDGTHMVGQEPPEEEAELRDWLRQSRASNRGFFASGMQMRFRDILDGLSNTIMVSETQSAVVGKRGLSGIAKDIEDLSNNPHFCLNVPKDPDVKFWEQGRGSRWCDGALAFTGFQTVLAPNSPSCSSDQGIEDAIVSASSHHPGGVFALMGDGAVVFITNTIDCGDPTAAGVHHGGTGASAPGSRSPYGLWGALGSRASQETIETQLNNPAPREGGMGLGGLLPRDSRPSSTWTDNTGKIKLSAKFSKIIDKKTIELEDNLGTLHQVPLNSLSDKDIFRAVQMDLKVAPVRKAGGSIHSRPPPRQRADAAAIQEYERAMRAAEER